MKLHARSVAASAGAPDALFDEVVAQLIESGEIKDWKAREIHRRAAGRDARVAPEGSAAGKVILLGEHGVVYGRHALALPIPDAVAVQAHAKPSADARSAGRVRGSVARRAGGG